MARRVVMGVGVFILCNGHRWRKAKEQQPWNGPLETIPSRFLLNRKQRSLLLYVICVQYTKFWVEIWNPLIPGQIVNSFGQGKCTFDCQSGNFKNYSSSNLNKVTHVENWETDQLQHYLYVDISYKFTLAWVFVSHACTQKE